MRTINFFNTVKHVVASLSLIMLSASSHATFINFDDIERIPTEGCFCDHPITNEYISKGLVIDNGYLVDQKTPGTAEGVSPPNMLLGGNEMSLLFVGNLPTYVELYVSTYLEQAAFFEVYGPSGLLFKKRTAGEAGPDESTPYFDNQFVSFESLDGISRISMSAHYNMRVGAIIDNLTFTYHVPESSTIALFGIGLLGLAMSRRRKIN
jgi:hypothetical protein